MIDAIRELAVVLCSLLIIICVVESILPEGGVSIVIKWVVLLFIIFNLVNSVKEIDTAQLINSFDSGVAMTEQGGTEILKQAEILLEDRIIVLFDAQNINFDSVDIEFLDDETGINISNVTISGINDEDKVIADEAVKAVVGVDTEVIYE